MGAGAWPSTCSITHGSTSAIACYFVTLRAENNVTTSGQPHLRGSPSWQKNIGALRIPYCSLATLHRRPRNKLVSHAHKYEKNLEARETGHRLRAAEAASLHRRTRWKTFAGCM